MSPAMRALLDRQAAIEADPANRMPPGSLWLYVPKARRALDRISRDITELLRQQREAAGDPVRADGYSGRQTNRRS